MYIGARSGRCEFTKLKKYREGSSTLPAMGRIAMSGGHLFRGKMIALVGNGILTDAREGQ